MSRHRLQLPVTEELKSTFMRKFKMEINKENLHAAWGFDAITGGYFLQIWGIDSEGYDQYIEDGLIGGGKGRMFSKLEKYGILEYIRDIHNNHFMALAMDEQF